MTLKAKVWKKHYEVEISQADHDALETYIRQGRVYIAEELEDVTCANDVDYCGRGSNNVFFSLAIADESEEEVQAILDIIAEYIKKAHEICG